MPEGRLRTLVLVMLASLLAMGVAATDGARPRTAFADTTTGGGDLLRTGWYPDQPRLSPAAVGAADFGQLFATQLDGQVYGQPLVSNGVLLVVTMTNHVYGLDPESGTILWSRSVGTPFNPDDIDCPDVRPAIGITSTPVIDSATSTAYFTAKSYVTGSSGATTYEMHAVDIRTGTERAGFPATIGGSASNDPGYTFNATYELQRPGLLLLDGVVYAAFGGHCDRGDWFGLVAGVNATSGRQTTLWHASTDRGDRSAGAGIWQAGGGLLSDGPGTFLVVTGNGVSPTGPTPGDQPPGKLAESVVRLRVQSDGSLKPTDFFTPYDAQYLDEIDADFGAGGPAGLPDSMGTTAVPHPLVVAGKQGYVFLLDRDHLGGMKEGANGSDAAVGRWGPYGGVWSKPGVWPGDGGYVYIPSGSTPNDPTSANDFGYLRAYKRGVDGSGRPTLSLAATSSSGYGIGSSHPIVTSDGTTGGSALVWVVWMADPSGKEAQLRAYDAVPVDGDFTLRFSAPVGTGSKFNPPGVGNGRVYVGNRDGVIRGFGAPNGSALSGPAVNLGAVTVGETASGTATLTASRAVTVSKLAVSGSGFALGSGVPATPVDLAAGGTLKVPVTFTPAAAGAAGGKLVATTPDGDVSVALTATGRTAEAKLTAGNKVLSLGGTKVGGTLTGSVTLTNSGAASLTISSVDTPDAPFTLSGAPAAGATLAGGDSVTFSVTFAPTTTGTFADEVTVNSTDGSVTVTLTGTAAEPGVLSVTPDPVDFGSVAVGSSADRTVTLENTGGSALTITKSKPPAGGAFTAVTDLPEGTTIPAGGTKELTVRFAPTVTGEATAAWNLTADDATGARTLSLRGTGS